MYFSSPIRLPYLDHRLIEFAFSLSSEMKIKEGQGEYVLKAALKEESTGSVLNVVQNFSPTHSLNLKALQKKVIFSPDLASLYSQREIEELYGRNERNAFSETDEILWRVFAFKLWLVN
jgi:asparagine synthase (glutamine-hydrolysing)